MLGEDVDIKVIKRIKELDFNVDAFEFELIFDTTYREYTETFTYTGGQLTKKEYWRTSAKTNKIWEVDYTWAAGKLSTKVITFVATGQTLTLTYTWTAGRLSQVDRVLS